MEKYTSEILCMGTLITQTIYGEDLESIACEVENEMRELERIMNFHNENSELSLLNRQAYNKHMKVSDDIFYVIKEAKQISEITNGAFDVTIGSIADLWGIFSDNERVPYEDEIANTLKWKGYKYIDINEKEKSIMFTNDKIKVDLGGIAKGYAADKAMEIYKKHGVKGAMINLGGNVSVYKAPLAKDYWCVGLQHPLKKRNELIGALYCKDETIVTSGNYERFFEKNGEKYGHIINTETGYPVENDLLSVTVVTKKSIIADGLATAFYAEGYEKSLKIIEKMDDIDAVFITKDEKVYVTNNILNRFVLAK